jgi:hypothetical protein
MRFAGSTTQTIFVPPFKYSATLASICFRVLLGETTSTARSGRTWAYPSEATGKRENDQYPTSGPRTVSGLRSVTTPVSFEAKKPRLRSSQNFPI